MQFHKECGEDKLDGRYADEIHIKKYQVLCKGLYVDICASDHYDHGIDADHSSVLRNVPGI